jgi:hypothetical protein
MSLTLDVEKDFVEMPLVTRPRTAATQLICVLLAKLTAPLANGLVSHAHTVLKQQFFDIAIAQAKPKVQPHRVADDFYRKPVIFIFRGSGRGCPCRNFATQ